MSDIGADQDAIIALVEAAENCLFARKPDHELISYMRLKSKEEREKEWQKLLRRFSQNPNEKRNVQDAMETTYALTQYLTALEVELGERDPPKLSEE